MMMALSSLLTACAVQQAQPLNDEQLALIRQQPTVLKVHGSRVVHFDRFNNRLPKKWHRISLSL